MWRIVHHRLHILKDYPSHFEVCEGFQTQDISITNPNTNRKTEYPTQTLDQKLKIEVTFTTMNDYVNVIVHIMAQSIIIPNTIIKNRSQTLTLGQSTKM